MRSRDGDLKPLTKLAPPAHHRWSHNTSRLLTGVYKSMYFNNERRLNHWIAIQAWIWWKKNYTKRDRMALNRSPEFDWSSGSYPRNFLAKIHSNLPNCWKGDIIRIISSHNRPCQPIHYRGDSKLALPCHADIYGLMKILPTIFGEGHQRNILAKFHWIRPIVKEFKYFKVTKCHALLLP